ncbi:hypothetical protein RB597_006907 [Gaeumannomyces tritici]
MLSSRRCFSACRSWDSGIRRLRSAPVLFQRSSRLRVSVSPSSLGNRWSLRCYTGDGSTYYDAKVGDIRNIGIIAHVDAGKTTTTERMLFHSGLTKHLGNVDSGDTVTDFLPMERDRGITIQSAAITFQWPRPAECAPGVSPKTVNLIDTPGHQDFRFEVDRCMPVLDGAVCIIDSVKGVEAHTERVWASAQQFSIPRILYVNKLDRDGASFQRSVSEIASRLNSWPLVLQIPWWDKDNFVGVIDVVNSIGYRWKSLGVKTTYSQEKLKAVLGETNPTLLAQMDEAYEALINTLCELDEEFLDRDLDNMTPEIIRTTIRKLISTGDGKMVPVFAGSSLRNIGVDPLLDAVVDYLPSANERPPLEVSIDGVKSTLEQAIKNQSSGKNKRPVGISALASVFKVANDFNKHDATKSMLSFVRVYHGKLPATGEVWNATRGAAEHAMSMVQISANKTHQIPHLSTAQIGALKGLKDAKTGDTLILATNVGHKWTENPLSRLQVRPAEIPHPVAFITMAPQSRSGIKGVESALERLSREDPSLRYSYNDKEEVFILSGMGRLHIEVSLDRLKTVYGLEANIFGIEVEYKECILRSTGPQRHLFDGVVNSKSGKAACTVTLKPKSEDGEEGSYAAPIDEDNAVRIIFAENPDGSGWPEGFDPERTRHELLSGAAAALRTGPRLRRPVHGCVASVAYDPATDFFGAGTPSSHNVKAAYNAVKACLKDAHARSLVGILEPVMRVDIACPEGAADAIQHDISGARGGTVLEVMDRSAEVGAATAAVADATEGGERIPLDSVYVPRDPYESVQSLRDQKKGLVRMLEMKAIVPFKEMLDYDSKLRSMTAGRHSLAMSLDTFKQVTGPREKAIG